MPGQELTPELPLGTAEQFLVTLSSITGLEARLRLWAFKMDFVALEKEICEPLGDLKQGLDILRNSQTFNAILSVILGKTLIEKKFQFTETFVRLRVEG